MDLKESIEIRKPVEEVFAFLAHHPNHKLIVKQNVSCEQVTPGPMGVGTRVKNVANLVGSFGRIEEFFEITEFDPPRVLAKASREGSSFETTDCFELRPTETGTEVTFVVTASAGSLGKKLVIALMKPLVKGSMADTLASLKSVVEAGK